MDTFTRLSRKIQNSILRSRKPSPKVILAEDSEEDLDLTSFKAEMKEWFHAPLFQLTNWPFMISLNDYFRNVIPLLQFYDEIKRVYSNRTDQPLFLDAAAPFFDDGAEMFAKMTEVVESVCRSFCYRAMQYDRRIVTWGMSHGAPDSPKRPLILSFRVTKPKVKYVKVDGRRRKSYQLGVPQCGHEILWHALETSVLDLPSGERVPVYVQSHAMDRLRSRLQPNSETDYSFYVIHDSLARPKVVQKKSEVSWLEAKSDTGGRVGYFLVEAVDGVALVKTFIFLTMKGTPESKPLYEMLDAQRDDIEHLKLDKLETFMKPDVIEDKELVTGDR